MGWTLRGVALHRFAQPVQGATHGAFPRPGHTWRSWGNKRFPNAFDGRYPVPTWASSFDEGMERNEMNPGRAAHLGHEVMNPWMGAPFQGAAVSSVGHAGALPRVGKDHAVDAPGSKGRSWAATEPERLSLETAVGPSVGRVPPLGDPVAVASCAGSGDPAYRTDDFTLRVMPGPLTRRTGMRRRRRRRVRERGPHQVELPLLGSSPSAGAGLGFPLAHPPFETHRNDEEPNKKGRAFARPLCGRLGHPATRGRQDALGA